MQSSPLGVLLLAPVGLGLLRPDQSVSLGWAGVLRRVFRAIDRMTVRRVDRQAGTRPARVGEASPGIARRSSGCASDSRRVRPERSERRSRLAWDTFRIALLDLARRILLFRIAGERNRQRLGVVDCGHRLETDRPRRRHRPVARRYGWTKERGSDDHDRSGTRRNEWDARKDRALAALGALLALALTVGPGQRLETRATANRSMRTGDGRRPSLRRSLLRSASHRSIGFPSAGGRDRSPASRSRRRRSG